MYFQPGTYRITKTLINPPVRAAGASPPGNGRSTVLAWDGEQGGRMFWTNQGILYARFVGLIWDGRGKAAVGFDHASQKIFETETRKLAMIGIEHVALDDKNDKVNPIQVGVKHSPIDQETLGRVSRALDDLRRLGQVEREMSKDKMP